MLRSLYGEISPVEGELSLGRLLDGSSDDYLVLSGRTSKHAWIADRYQLPLRPRQDPWRVLRASAPELHRVSWAEVIDGSIWERWRAGKRVREVVLGFVDRPVVRGKLQRFEEGLWDGTAPDPDPEPRLEPVPPEEAYDIDALIAAEPPGSLHVDAEGHRLLYITAFPRDPDDRYAPDLPYDRRYGSGFTSDGEVFIDLDRINVRPVWDEVEDRWIDQKALVAAAVEEWFGLAGAPESWDWAGQAWIVHH
ncbi:hypothetical protein ACQBAT_06135 [Ornithinimicrobium sp. Y1847]|uniref:hypothetical protein n=1 Tax=Ornithinimicrobium sp. Y1847 TaxID=3405419 RepID=UPI003B681649